MRNDAEAFAAALATARMGWMTGQLAKVDLPDLSELSDLSDLGEKDAHLRLLALDAQFRALVGAPVLSPDPVIAPHMPEAAKPVIPDAARDWFERSWRGVQQTDKVKLLRLLDRRGYVAHPFDFVPQSDWDGLPDAYAPWLEWSRTSVGGPSSAANADGYGTYSGAATRRHFVELCSTDRVGAMSWLETELAGGNAAQRLRLLSDVAPYLTHEDEPFLARLQDTDRSGKVTALAVQILRRNGCATPKPEDLSALDYLERSKSGLLRRKVRIGTPAKINQTRVNLLRTLLGQIGLADLADFFGLTPGEFVAAWDWDNAHADVSNGLQQCIFETAGDAECRAVVRLRADNPRELGQLDAAHMDRLGPDARSEVIAMLIEGLPTRDQALWQLTDTLTKLRLDGLDEAQGAALWDKARGHPDLNPASGPDKSGFEPWGGEIRTLAMCLNAPQARAALELFAQRGVHGAEPMLAPLQLNIALTDISQERP